MSDAPGGGVRSWSVGDATNQPRTQEEARHRRSRRREETRRGRRSRGRLSQGLDGRPRGRGTSWPPQRPRGWRDGHDDRSRDARGRVHGPGVRFDGDGPHDALRGDGGHREAWPGRGTGRDRVGAAPQHARLLRVGLAQPLLGADEHRDTRRRRSDHAERPEELDHCSRPRDRLRLVEPADEGEGFAIMMQTVLPAFNLMSAAFSVGLMEGAVARTAAHASGSRYAHMDAALADFPTIRAYIARMRVDTDMAKALLAPRFDRVDRVEKEGLGHVGVDAIDAVESGREDAMLRVLECKAAA